MAASGVPVSGALVWEATSYPGHVERRGDVDATAGAARYMCAEIPNSVVPTGRSWLNAVDLVKRFF